MPVYFFAISQVEHIYWRNAVIVFLILHILVYPASNGYNSYMDKDESSIGGIKNPLQPTRQLFMVTVCMDVAAVIVSFLVTPVFASGILIYILASRAYSYRKIRLKKFPVAGYLSVVIFQGAVTFFLVYYSCNSNLSMRVPVIAMLAASLLIGGFYPLTQIYQHDADCRDGVTTISYKLGYAGTFIFTGIVYALAFCMLALQFLLSNTMKEFIILQICMLPVIIYFLIWFIRVLKDNKEASFRNTMRMNLLASACTNLGFMIILIIHLT